MTASRKPSSEARAPVPAAAVAPRSGGPDALSTVQHALGNQDFQQLMGPLSTEATPDGGPSDATSTETEPAASPVHTFVVDDDAETLGPGQMRRTGFLAAVRAAVCGTANEGFAGTGRTADDCPWIEHWLGFYESRDAAHLDRSLRRFAPETADAGTARDAITMIAARVRQSVDAYVETGEVTGVPDGFSADVPGLSLLGGLFGGLLFKARAGGPVASASDPRAVRAELGAGQPMPGGVRSRMERAFGAGFAHVRLHQDGAAGALSSRLNARAFTVGEHVAFGAGEYRPGTVIGDALLAHELAHTIQQGAVVSAAQGHDGVASESLEADADRAAGGAVASLWGNARGADRASTASPRMRSGLRLSRCTPSPQTPDKAKLAGQLAKPPGATQPPGPTHVEEPPPDPEQSYWFQDPKKQVPEASGAQQVDLSKSKEPGGSKVTNTAQQQQQVVVDTPDKYSNVGSLYVRFAYPGTGFTGHDESAEIKSAKAAVLAALTTAVDDIADIHMPEREWFNEDEKRALLAEELSAKQRHARLSEVFKAFTLDKPLNVYLAPMTEAEMISGNYYPTTAQVWVSMKDVGDATKLTTAMRLPLHHVLGGPNLAQGGAMDPPADLKRTMLHEGLHTMLINRKADSATVWGEVESGIAVDASAEIQARTMELIHAYVLAQEELFAYENEESLYAPVASGPQQSAKVSYVFFMHAAELFFNGKSPKMAEVKKPLDVSEQVEEKKTTKKKKVQWEVVYKYPAALKVADTSRRSLDQAIGIFPLTQRRRP